MGNYGRIPMEKQVKLNIPSTPFIVLLFQNKKKATIWFLFLSIVLGTIAFIPVNTGSS